MLPWKLTSVTGQLALNIATRAQQSGSTAEDVRWHSNHAHYRANADWQVSQRPTAE